MKEMDFKGAVIVKKMLHEGMSDEEIASVTGFEAEVIAKVRNGELFAHIQVEAGDERQVVDRIEKVRVGKMTEAALKGLLEATQNVEAGQLIITREQSARFKALYSHIYESVCGLVQDVWTEGFNAGQHAEQVNQRSEPSA